MVSLFILLTALYFLFVWRQQPRYRSKTKSTEAPDLPGAWPIIGHLHLLGGRELAHKVLGAMADKYGPVFRIRIGVHRAIVVTSSEIAKECYTTNDRVFASRPSSTSAEILGYNYASFGFAPYGPYWREIRKIMMSELLSSRRLESLKHVRDSEIDTSIKELYKLSKENGQVSIEMKQWFGDLNLNMVLMMVVGKRYFGAISDSDGSESRRCQEAMRDFMRLSGVFMVEDALPYLRWFDLQGYKKEMKNTAKELDSLFQGCLDERKMTRLAAGEAKEEQDFMGVMLEHAKISHYDNDTIIKTTCLTIITGASDTTMLTLTWILSLLLNNKQVLKRAQDELDSHVGRDRNVKESDIKNLIYLQAIIKEALRLYPAGPLSGLRVATEDCTLAGYHVPAGTRLLVNLWKIHRAPLVWSDPNEFLPERFLTSHKDMDVKGQHYDLLPFSAGRRACPGITFALQVMPFIMARLLHAFELITPMDVPVDMTETAGLTIVKATPLEVVITSRLPPELYGL